MATIGLPSTTVFCMIKVDNKTENSAEISTQTQIFSTKFAMQ